MEQAIDIPGYTIHETLLVEDPLRVMRATENETGRNALISLLITDDDERRARFLARSRAFASVTHERIARIYAQGEHEGHAFVSFAYAEGGTLRDHMQAKKLKPEDVLWVIREIASALETLHAQGYIIAPLRPDAIHFTEEGVPMIVDIFLGEGGDDRASYIAPEVLDGAPFTPASDYFSLGSIFYEALTRKAYTPNATLSKEHARHLIIFKALTRNDATKRIRTASTLIHAIDKATQTPAIKTEHAPQTRGKSASPPPAIIVLAIVIAVVLLVGGYFIGKVVSQSNTPVRSNAHANAETNKEQTRGINEPDSEGNTLLHSAVITSDAQEVVTLISRGAHIDAKNKATRTPLHIAAKNGNGKITALLLAKGADVTIIDSNGWTPLHYAATADNTNALLHILRADADPNVKNRYKNAALHMATAKDKTNAITLLIEHGADINEKGYAGYTPLAIAVQMNARPMMLLLLTNNANPNVANDAGDTPLHIAVRKKEHDAVAILKAAGADIYARNNKGETPLSMAEGRIAETLYDLTPTPLSSHIAQSNVTHSNEAQSNIPPPIATTNTLGKNSIAVTTNAGDTNTLVVATNTTATNESTNLLGTTEDEVRNAETNDVPVQEFILR